MHQHSHSGRAENRFSVLFFVTVIALSLGLLYTLVAFLAPTWIITDIEAGWKAIVIAFILVHLVNSFVEFFFHRYVLHAPFVPFLAYFYKQHTHHHSLTSVRLARTDNAVENKFPILIEEQHEASFFPAYSLLVFALLATPLFMLVKWLSPDVPVFLPGYAAIAFSLVLYELLHALEHKPVESWKPFLEHKRFGNFFKLVYAFHLRHHADIDSNEAISGFFGFPVADLLFGTWVNPQTLYEHRTSVDKKEFVSPRPRFIGRLDRYAKLVVRTRREKLAA